MEDANDGRLCAGNTATGGKKSPAGGLRGLVHSNLEFTVSKGQTVSKDVQAEIWSESGGGVLVWVVFLSSKGRS